MMLKIVLLFTLALSAFSQVSVKDFNELQSRVEEIELYNYTRNFSLSGQMINLYEAYKSETVTNVSTGAKGHERLNLWASAVSLNIDYDVNSKIKFYSTLGMSKFWNNEGRDGDAEDYWNRSNQGSLGYQGSTARFDKAFFTYSPGGMYSWAIGRMPTNAGPPQHQLDGIERSGTYPRMAYNSIFDGIALSLDFAKFMPKDQSLKLKLFYTPYMNVDDDSRIKQRKTGSSVTGKPGPNVKVNSDTLLWAFLLEYEASNLSWVKNIEMYIFTLNYEDFWWDSYGDTYRGWGYNWTLGLNGIAHTGLNFWMSFIGTDWQALADNKHINGEGYLFNLNYKFDNTQVVGAEYLATNKNYYLDEWTYYNIAPFYKTADMKGYHLYWSLPLADNLRLRLGTYQYEVAHSNLYNKADVESYYTMLRLAF